MVLIREGGAKAAKSKPRTTLISRSLDPYTKDFRRDARRMKLLRNAGAAVGLAGELLTFLATNKRRWLTPKLIVLFLFAAVTIAGQSSGISPFVYTLF
jgi:Family of unknown function (DUF5989)